MLLIFIDVLSLIMFYLVGGFLPPPSPSGTYFAEYGQVLNCNVGGVISFQGNLFHGGHPITAGIRYILVAFLYSHKEDEEEEGKDKEQEEEEKEKGEE